MADSDASIENRKIIIGIIIFVIVTAIIIYLAVSHNKSNNNLDDNNTPTLTMPPLKQNIDEILDINNTQQKNEDEIPNINNEPYFTPTPIITTIITTIPPTTMPPTTMPPTTMPPTTMPPTTMPPTTMPPTTPQITTIKPKITTPKITTKPSITKEQEIINNFASQQSELVRAIELQKEKEKEDLFNIPLIPVFNSNADEALIPSEGLYQVRAIAEAYYYPCYDITPIRIKNDGEIGYLGFINGGNLGSLFDNNDTTGVLFQGFSNNNELNFIIITMPVMKTFKGKLKMNFFYPWAYGPWLANNMTINTANNFTNNDLKNQVYEQYLYFFKSFAKIDAYGSYNSNNNYLESIRLDIKRDSDIVSYSWDIELTKPFNSIIFNFNGGGNPSRVWITSISFEKSR